MNNTTTDSNAYQLIRELRFTRIICMISSALTICLLIGGIFLFHRVEKLSQMCEPAMEKISEIDVDSFNSTMDRVNTSLEDVNWNQIAEALNKLDVDALNEAIEGLDTKEFSEALTNLNDAVENIRGLSEKLNALTAPLFGRIAQN